MDFTNKVCVITGGAKGIGRIISNEFVGRGSKIAVIDIDKEAGEALIKSLREKGSEVVFYCGDISDEKVLTDFSSTVVKAFGSIDFLINNACLSKKGILSGCSFEDFNYVLRVGVSAPYMLSRLFSKHFNEGGAIVNIASTRAFMSQADTESYTAAKGGIIALTHALAISMSGKVRVNSISPGWIETDSRNDLNHSLPDKNQHPVKRVGRPQDIARAVMFLCDSENGFITGENLTVDGGMTKLMIYNGDNGWEYRA